MAPVPELRPTPDVTVLSPFGIEYVFLTIALLLSAGSLIAVLLALVNGNFDASVLSLPAAVLTVSVPTFALLFLRLKKLELTLPELRFDASKLRSTQLVQIVTFVACLLAAMTFVFSVFASISGEGSLPFWKAALDALCVIVVAGGILAYYWRDEHVHYKAHRGA